MAEPPHSERAPALLLLAIASGGIDAVVLSAFGALVAAQTGNTVLLGIALGQGPAQQAVPVATSVVGYVVGVVLGERIFERSPPARPLARPLAVELVLLACILVAWLAMGEHPDARGKIFLVALAAITMGIQSATVLDLHSGPTTTYVTGTLTTFSTWVARRLRRGPEPGSVERPWLDGLTWAVYLAGAITSALLGRYSITAALAVPMALIATVIGLERRNANGPGARAPSPG